MIETKNIFSQIIRQYYIDLSQIKSILLDSIPKDRPFLRVRASVIREEFISGYSWNSVLMDLVLDCLRSKIFIIKNFGIILNTIYY